MDNKDLYRKAVDQIHASEDLKKKTIDSVQSRNSKMVYMKYLAACAVFVLAIAFGIFYVSEDEVKKAPNDFYALEKPEKDITSIQDADLPTFKNMDELRKILEENNSYSNYMKDMAILDVAEEQSITNAEQPTASYGERKTQNLASDYSTTNVQVEGVDEADIIKTDGKYIYYVTDSNILHIIDADTLEEVFTINYSENNELSESFSPFEIYLTNNQLVVLGNYDTYAVQQKTTSYDIIEDVAITNANHYAKAIIYDISNPKDISVAREIKVDGFYSNSRMIGNNLYFISTKTPMYYNGVKDIDLLPCYQVNSEEKVYVPADRIVYFPNTNNYSYVIIAGVDVSKEEEVNIASFFGSWPDKIYASESNLYIPTTTYWGEKQSNEIYKFHLNQSRVEFVAKGKFEGYLDSQFSIDEYDGFLRIATTSGFDENATNTLYIFNENLEEVSKLADFAEGERIYSVRFMGKVGYIVTFEQIDPLFVVDLSDPYHPEIKGELEMPGYSSYLHPYDETHIIGIGYNVKSNGYGGVTNSNMKMAMFDVSDLSNPKEMFSINIGDDYVSTELNYNHKALFYSKTKRLIGFPITTWDSNYYYSKNNFTVYDIDLENGFIEHGKIVQEQKYNTSIKRAIYIDNSLFTIAENQITKYDLNTFEKIQELEIDS